MQYSWVINPEKKCVHKQKDKQQNYVDAQIEPFSSAILYTSNQTYKYATQHTMIPKRNEKKNLFTQTQPQYIRPAISIPNVQYDSNSRTLKRIKTFRRNHCLLFILCGQNIHVGFVRLIKFKTFNGIYTNTTGIQN